MKLDFNKLVMGILTMLVTGLGYFVWDMHAWKASMGDLDAVTFVTHVKDQELANQKVVLLLEIQAIKTEEVPK
jgi:hypothetical protein